MSAWAQHDGPTKELQNMSAKVAKLQELRVERPKLPRNLKMLSLFHGPCFFGFFGLPPALTDFF